MKASGGSRRAFDNYDSPNFPGIGTNEKEPEPLPEFLCFFVIGGRCERETWLKLVVNGFHSRELEPRLIIFITFMILIPEKKKNLLQFHICKTITNNSLSISFMVLILDGNS